MISFYLEHCSNLFLKYNKEITGAVTKANCDLTEKQLIKVFCEALICGDFIKLVVNSSSSPQQVIYLPYSEYESLNQKYNELIMAVITKFPEESRHDTALRYIIEAENKSNSSDAKKT